MIRNLFIFIVLSLIIVLPFVFHFEDEDMDVLYKEEEDVLVIITPHNNAITEEMDRGFTNWYKEKTGRNVRIDWRRPGGTSELSKYLESVYTNSFRLYWESVLHKAWNTNIQYAYKNHRLDGATPVNANLIEIQARKAFLESNVGGDIDVVYGGGIINFSALKKHGVLVPFKLFELKPEWFNVDVIPEHHAGTLLYDPKGYWFGTTLSTFGIIYNKETLEGLNLGKPLVGWEDLTNPLLFDEIGATDPTRSGSMSTTFEMIVQHEMHVLNEELRKSHLSKSEREEEVLGHGWENALRILQKIAANTRNFSERSGKAILDVSSGNCAVGIAVDYQAYTHAKNLEHRSETERLGFLLPLNGTALSPDCIGLLRGAPHSEIGKLFIEYTLTMEAQKLSAFKPGTPGGPEEYVLCRSAIRKDFYRETNSEYWFDSSNRPYEATSNFIYKKEWTDKTYHPLRFITKAAFINAHSELKSAWNAIIEARNSGNEENANKALALFEELPSIDYRNTIDTIAPILASNDPLEQIELETNLTKIYIKKYKQVELLAKKETTKEQN